MKATTYIIRAKNGSVPENTDVFAETTSENEAKQMLFEAQNQFDYVDVLIDGRRYRTIN